MVIERDPVRYHAAIENGVLAIDADASQEDVLKRAGIERARGLITAVGTDAENVYTVLSARVLRPDLFIISRSESGDSARKLQRAGANPIGTVGLDVRRPRSGRRSGSRIATLDNLDLAMETITIAPQSGARGSIDSGCHLRSDSRQSWPPARGPAMEFNPDRPSPCVRAPLVVLRPPTP